MAAIKEEAVARMSKIFPKHVIYMHNSFGC